MKRIIVPTDFSDAAWNAFLYAVELAKKLSTDITIINSYLEPHSGAASIVSIARILKEDSEKGLDSWLKKIKESGLDYGLDIQAKSIHSGLIDALNSQIKAYKEQIVVMGSLGETGALEKLVGSNASHVTSKVRCPIFIIPPDAIFSFSRRIVFATDFNKLPQGVNLELLKELCLLHPSDSLDVVQVINTGEAANEKALDSFFWEIPYQTHVIPGSDVSEALDQYVSESMTDLLVLIKEKKGLIQRLFETSVTKKLSVHAQTPLLILKAVE